MSTAIKDQDDEFMKLSDLTELGTIAEDDNDHLKLVINNEEDEEPIAPPTDVEEDEPIIPPNTVEEDEDEELLKKESDGFKTALGSIFGKDAFDTFEFEGEDGNIVEVKFKDAVIDSETFIALSTNKLKEIQEEANKDKISTESLSEFLKTMIDIEKNGGQTQQMFDLHKMYIEPLDTFDLETEDGQKKAIILGLRINGENDEDIQDRITLWEGRGVLEDKAKAFDANIRTAVDARVQETKDIAVKAKEKKEAELGEFRKAVKTNLVQFELNDKAKDRLINMVSKPNAKGQFDIDRLYFEKRNDPKETAELALYLADKEEFKKQITKDVVREKQLETGRRIRITLPSSGMPIVKSKSKRGEDDEFIELPKTSN